ncbi:MAG: hypothetical protein NVS2B3_10590 [Vulcanimicrobiaceae bacterium]
MNVRFGREIAAAAERYHIDPRLLAAVAAQETGGPGSNSGNNVVGDGGHGRGVFQIDDRAWDFASTPAAMDPAANAAMAARILRGDLDRYGGDVRRALSAYNAGSPDATGTRTRWPDGRILGYADSVMRHYDALGGAASGIAADTRDALATGDAPAIARLAALLGRANAAAMSASSAPLAPMTTWAQLNEPGSAETASADAAIAKLVDSGDVFGSEDADEDGDGED